MHVFPIRLKKGKREREEREKDIQKETVGGEVCLRGLA